MHVGELVRPRAGERRVGGDGHGRLGGGQQHAVAVGEVAARAAAAGACGRAASAEMAAYAEESKPCSWTQPPARTGTRPIAMTTSTTCSRRAVWASGMRSGRGGGTWPARSPAGPLTWRRARSCRRAAPAGPRLARRRGTRCPGGRSHRALRQRPVAPAALAGLRSPRRCGRRASAAAAARWAAAFCCAAFCTRRLGRRPPARLARPVWSAARRAAASCSASLAGRLLDRRRLALRLGCRPGGGHLAGVLITSAGTSRPVTRRRLADHLAATAAPGTPGAGWAACPSAEARRASSSGEERRLICALQLGLAVDQLVGLPVRRPALERLVLQRRVEHQQPGHARRRTRR